MSNNCLVICSDLEDQPGPPTNVVALPHSSSSIIVSWSPPVGNYSIRAYTIHYRQLDNVNSLERDDVVGQDTNSRVVSGLFGFTNYSFYVKAYTKVIGRESEIIVQRTLQGSKLTVPLYYCTTIIFATELWSSEIGFSCRLQKIEYMYKQHTTISTVCNSR